jgi:kinetochore protein Spc25
MKIEGVKEDVLRIVYSHISETDWMREYSLTIDLSERDYKGATRPNCSLTLVIECKPSISQLDELVQKLNRTREFFEFLKWMRQAFKEQSSK